MKYTQLGNRGPSVSSIGFGAWAVGGLNWGKTDDQTSLNAINEAIDKGVTFFDTADVYGFGHSEELLAKVIKQRSKKNIIIATKAGSDFYNATKEDDKGYGPIRPNYSPNYLISAVEKSLKRLNTEALDILQLHSPGLEVLDKEEVWKVLETLKKEGKILHAGLSIQSFKETEQAHLLDLHYDLLDCIQVRYNLLEREAEKVLFPKALEYGIGVIVRIPLLFGLLTGKFTEESSFKTDDHRHMNLSPEKLKLHLKQLQDLKALFDHFPDQSKAEVSLRFCLSHPACQTVIPGAKTPQQVNENCRSGDLGPIPVEILTRYSPQ